MNWDRMEGEWKQRRGKAVHRWGRVMNDDLAAIAGKYEELVGRLQERYGIAEEKSKQQVKDFKRTIAQLKQSNSKLILLQKSVSNKERASRRRAGSRNKSGKTIRSK